MCGARATASFLIVTRVTRACGLNVTQWGCHFGDNQLWHAEQAPGSNYFTLTNEQSGRVLEVSGNQSTQNGANIQTWTYDGSGDMKWQVTRH